MQKRDEPFVPINIRQEGIVTVERAAKGDLAVKWNVEGVVIDAVSLVRFVVNELIAREWLDIHHEAYGLGFLELRAAFRSPWAARSGAVLLEQWGIGMSAGIAASVYQTVSREIGGKGVEIVGYCMETPFVDVESLGRFSKGHYQEYFDKLVVAMDTERERARNIFLK